MNDPRQPETINEALWNFPHRMTLKVFGDATTPDGEASLADIVCAIVTRHLGDYVPENLVVRPSSGGRFLAVSVDLCVHNAQQVEGIYRDLRAEPRVRTAL